VSSSSQSQLSLHSLYCRFKKRTLTSFKDVRQASQDEGRSRLAAIELELELELGSGCFVSAGVSAILMGGDSG